MKAVLRDWLLTCPDVRNISKLVLDANQAGLLDLPDAMARAVAIAVRLNSIGECTLSQPPGYHRRTARMMAFRRRTCFLQLASDTIVLAGSIAQGVGISQTSQEAAIHIRATLPETIVTSMPGERLSRFVECSRFAFGNYPVIEAEQDDCGITVWLNVPRLPIAAAF